MQKCALILSLLILGHAFSSDETEKYVLVGKILAKTGVVDFAAMVDQVKSGDSVNPVNSFAQKSELGPEEELFWKNFPLSEYTGGLQKQMMNLFNLAELKKIESFYRNPFHAKILVHFNTDAAIIGLLEKFEKLDLDQVKLSKKRIVLIQSLVNLHKINPLVQDQKRKLKERIERQEKLLEVLKLADETRTMVEKERNEKILEEFDLLTLKFLGKSFKNFRTSELREMSRVMSSKEVQDFAQLAVSYHYYFIENYKKDFRRQQKTKEAIEKKKEFRR